MEELLVGTHRYTNGVFILPDTVVSDDSMVAIVRDVHGTGLTTYRNCIYGEVQIPLVVGSDTVTYTLPSNFQTNIIRNSVRATLNGSTLTFTYAPHPNEYTYTISHAGVAAAADDVIEFSYVAGTIYHGSISSGSNYAALNVNDTILLDSSTYATISINNVTW